MWTVNRKSMMMILVIVAIGWVMSSAAPTREPDRMSEKNMSLHHRKRHYYSQTLASEFRRIFDRPFDFVLSGFRTNLTDADMTSITTTTTEASLISTTTIETTTTEASLISTTTMDTTTTITTSSTTSTSTTSTTTPPPTITLMMTTTTTNDVIVDNSTISMAGENSTTTAQVPIVEVNQSAPIFPLLNDANMILYNWINRTNSSIPFPNLSAATPAAVLFKRMNLSEMFQYNTSWIIGLAVIATVIGVFFLGCVIVICYTRRPYRRSGKVYEIESTAKKNQKIPQVPTIHPATKTATLTRSKEVYY